MKLLLLSLALGSSIIDVVSAGCCNTCDVPYPYKPVGTCRWVACQYGRTDITCDFGKREALIDLNTGVDSTEEVVEKREAGESRCQYCDSYGHCIWKECRPPIGKREGPLTDTECTCENGKCELCSAVGLGCTAVTNCDVKREVTEVAVEKRETEEVYFASCNCKNGRCTECHNGACAPVSSCRGKTVEKREEKKCSLNCHATDCFYLPRGCVPTEDKKREVVEVRNKRWGCSCEYPGKCERCDIFGRHCKKVFSCAIGGI